jgi:cytochrome c biogenesis protein ResB
MPLEWQSKLSILEFDEHGHPVEVAGGEVRVNDYFIHGGYRFFQTNHNPNDPTYSGIGVVYDLGLPLVLWGLYCVMFATAFIFLIMPLIKGSKTRGQD